MMPDLTYFMATPGYSGQQITMLSTGDADADTEKILEHARGMGWEYVVVRKMVSTSSGDEKMEDGKDVFRYHSEKNNIAYAF